MRKRDLEQLERRSERTAAALNFIGVLASREGLQALLQKAPRKWVHAECKRAVALCTGMARGNISGPSGVTVNPSAAKDHLEQLEGALVRDDAVSVRLHAGAALRAFGFVLLPEETPHAPPKSRAAKGAAASQRRGKKSRP